MSELKLRTVGEATKELERKLAVALDWQDLKWEEGYNRTDRYGLHEVMPTGWYGKGPGYACFFYADGILREAWQKRDFATIRTMMRVVEDSEVKP